ncbi:MAG: hypothetical protein NTX31_10380, partial [Burkholderiales bacterium]|nr:hypothetical protein [Burkholderiales bacterium]
YQPQVCFKSSFRYLAFEMSDRRMGLAAAKKQPDCVAAAGLFACQTDREIASRSPVHRFTCAP